MAEFVRVREWFKLACALVLAMPCAHADEGGVSFWLPGNFGSFSAVPGDPGWTIPLIYCHSSGKAGAGKDLPRGGRITAKRDFLGP